MKYEYATTFVVILALSAVFAVEVTTKDKRGVFGEGLTLGHDTWSEGHDFAEHSLDLGHDSLSFGNLDHHQNDHHDPIDLGSYIQKHVTITKKIGIPVPHPYPVHVEKKVSVPYPVHVKVPVDKPYPVAVPKPYPVPVEKPVPYTVEKHVPVPVKVPVKVPYPVKVPVHVPKPYPVTITKHVPVHIPQPVIVKKPVPVFIKPHYEEVFHSSWSAGGHGLESGSEWKSW